MQQTPYKANTYNATHWLQMFTSNYLPSTDQHRRFANLPIRYARTRGSLCAFALLPVKKHTCAEYPRPWAQHRIEYSQQQATCLRVGLCRRIGIQSVALAPNPMAKPVYQVLAPCPRTPSKIAIKWLSSHCWHSTFILISLASSSVPH